MAAGVTFDRQSAQRITKVVRRVERIPQSLGTPAPTPEHRGVKHWAKITGSTLITVGADSPYRKYSWERAIPDPTQPRGFAVDATVTGTLNAREVNRNVNVPVGEFVELEYLGIDGGGVPLFGFTYSASESVGQYIYQVRSMVAQNVAGWDVTRASAPVI